MLKTQIFLITSTWRSGHGQTLLALKEAIGRNPDTEIVSTSLCESHRPWGQWLANGFVFGLKKNPHLWEILYDRTEGARLTRRALPLLRRLAPPDIEAWNLSSGAAIVATHALGLLSLPKNMNAPRIGVVTDFCANAAWGLSRADLYIAPTPGVRQELLRQGVVSARIQVTGLPLRASFKNLPAARERARRRLGALGREKALLLLGGSHGLGPIFEIAQALLSNPQAEFTQLWILCGDNENLRNRLQKEFGRQACLPAGRRARIFGTIQDTAPFFAASDIVLTKPGGVTLSEALAMGKPLVLFPGAGGPESKNASCLLKAGAAWMGQTVPEVIQLTLRLLRDKKARRRLARQARILGECHKNSKAAEVIQAFVKKWWRNRLSDEASGMLGCSGSLEKPRARRFFRIPSLLAPTRTSLFPSASARRYRSPTPATSERKRMLAFSFPSE